KLDRQVPALRWHRACALGVLGRAAPVAYAGRNAAEGGDAQSVRAHAVGSRALCAQSQARAPARAREPLPDHHHGECGCDDRRRRRGRGGSESREPRAGGFTRETVAEDAIAHEGDDEREPAEAIAGSDEHGEPRPGAEQNGDGERRRRRRGRRGGRRNRRGREGESFAPETTAEPEMDRSDFADEPTGEAASAAPEPEPSPIAHAEASRDVPPRTETAPQETQSAPIARPSHPETTAPESPPRRRSTVREPAQVLRDD